MADTVECDRPAVVTTTSSELGPKQKLLDRGKKENLHLPQMGGAVRSERQYGKQLNWSHGNDISSAASADAVSMPSSHAAIYEAAQEVAMGLHKMSARFFLALGAILLLGSSGSADLTNQLYEITEPISPAARQEFADVISSFAKDIPDKSIKFRLDENNHLIFIRIEEDRFCLEASCITVITRQCGHPNCQYTTAFVPPRYRWHSGGDSKIGIFIHFPKKFGESVVIAVSDHFIASYQGL